MANDDETVYRAARAATAKVAGNLKVARENVSTARVSFKGMVGLVSWDSLGERWRLLDRSPGRMPALMAPQHGSARRGVPERMR